MSKAIDFTEGNIIKKLAVFAVPIVLGELLQNLYNTVDSMVVGNFVGGYALAAVSVCAAISQLVVGFFNGMSVGASVIVARFYGAGEPERQSTAMRVTFAFSVILGVALSIVGILITPWLVGLISIPGEVYREAVIYLRIYLAGIMFTVIYNVGAGLLRAVGDSRNPFYILVIVCGLNIVLDLLFVTKFGWGVAGVSIATVISQMISVLMVYSCLKKHDPLFRLSFKGLKAERQIIVNMVGIGMPAGLQNSLISFSNLFVWRYISGFDAAAMAGVGAAQRIDRFIGLPCKAFGLALTTYISQNVGARHYDRLRKGFWYCMGLSLLYLFVTSSVIYVFADESVRLFNSEPDVVAVGISMMKTILPFYFLLAFREVCLGALRGYGDTRIPMLLSLLGMVVLRQIYLAVAMSVDYGIIHIYICYPLAWGATTALTFVYYLAVRGRYETAPCEAL